MRMMVIVTSDMMMMIIRIRMRTIGMMNVTFRMARMVMINKQR